MTDEPRSGSPPPELTPARLLFALVGLALHLVAGFLIVVSGLVAPYWAVWSMFAVWLVLLAVGLKTWRVRPWVTVGFPVLAYVVWVVTVTAGDALLGWTA